MKIIYRTGDLLEASERIICHGCNAQGKMGAGIAVAIRKRYPQAFKDYEALYKAQGNRLDLGQCVWVECPDGRTVIDAVTQEIYGRDPNIVYVDYDAVRTVMRTINDRLKSVGGPDMLSVGLPKIGAGLANGDWAVIEEIIETESIEFQPVVYTL